MSSAGHFISLIGIAFFYIAILDSHLERKTATPSTLGVPR
jgi:hypothetical protein